MLVIVVIDIDSVNEEVFKFVNVCNIFVNVVDD